MKQQLADLRERVVRYHEQELAQKTRGQAGKEEEKAREWMLKAEVEGISELLRQREEDHEEEKARLHAYCIDLEEQASQATEDAAHAQVNVVNRLRTCEFQSFAVSATLRDHASHLRSLLPPSPTTPSKSNPTNRKAQADAAHAALEADRESSRQDVFRLQEQIEELAQALKTQEKLVVERNLNDASLQKRLTEAEATKEDYKQHLDRRKGIEEEVGTLRAALQEASVQVAETERRMVVMEAAAGQAKTEERRRVLREQRRLIERDLMVEMEKVEKDLAAATTMVGGEGGERGGSVVT